MLGFGALLCVLLALHKGNKRALVIKLGLAAWFAGQAALTLSRGGIYGFIFGCLAVALVGLFTKGFRSRVLTVAVMAGIIGFLVFGWLNVFTGGALQNRFDSTDSTNRTGVIDSDLELWQSNLAFGTGVGLSQYERDASAATLDISTHTEYTRLLAEHGLLGLAALGCMVSMCVSAIRNSMSRWNRLIAAGLVALSAIQMAHSATRIATIAFAIGLANLRVEE
jgi:O-antigen ligase